MEAIQRVQATIDYIEEHLTTEIAMSELAREACYSAFHFHRLFQLITGVSAVSYIKNRRLDRAATELICSNRKIVDIALEYGFGCHETFTRAFKRCFQTTPGEYRKTGRHVPIFPRISLKIDGHQGEGGTEMKPIILNKPEMKVVGYAIRTSTVDQRSLREIPIFWQRYIAEKMWETIPNKLNDRVEMGVSIDCDCEGGDFTYLIGYETDGELDLTDSELISRTLPAATYAVFTTPPVPEEKFSDTIQATWKEIFQNWFPDSGYEHAGAPEIELYDERTQNREAKQMDIYIPIQPRMNG